jgi:hypothetical protein
LTVALLLSSLVVAIEQASTHHRKASSSQLEISGNTQSGAGRNAQLLGSLSCNVSKLLVLDMYLARARNSFNGVDGYVTTAGTGFTYLLAK